MNQMTLIFTPTSYVDLEIRILELPEEGYPVEITFRHPASSRRAAMNTVRYGSSVLAYPERCCL